MSTYGFVRVAAASPVLQVANPGYNITEIEKLVSEAEKNDAALIVFPELSLTGYTCGDLFSQQRLLKSSLEALKTLSYRIRELDILCLVGAPLLIEGALYNCAVAVKGGKILGIVPKMYLSNTKEYYEKRWFSPGLQISAEIKEIELDGEIVPFGRLLFSGQNPEYVLGAEICEDLWMPIPPSSDLVLRGANIIANLSASDELVAKADYRRRLVMQQSARGICGYVYTSAGVHESSTDAVYSGDAIICENGAILASSVRFSRENEVIYADLDIEVLNHERRSKTSFSDCIRERREQGDYRTVKVSYHKRFQTSSAGLKRKVAPNPFLPPDKDLMDSRCEVIFDIQVAGLAKRLEHTNSRHAVVGVSGGLDSTLALLVTKKTFDLLNRPARDILALTMPGFGTTDRTRHNALDLMEELDVTIKEIDITKACLQHFHDIGHDPSLFDATYENVQARERMQILMDFANKTGGLVIGTGDLSELALGWTTYNGDHMSMYAVNCGVPKTLVKYLLRWIADKVETGKAGEILHKILDTPISPELLPPGADGGINQKTENLIGPYELHDFFLFYMLRYGMRPKKIQFLAETAFKGVFTSAEIKKWLILFYRRFFQNQFKRSCLPDGPKVGSVSLSPRCGWRMPSDADVSEWIKELED